MEEKKTNVNMSLYELNRSLVSQMGEMDFTKHEEAELLVNRFIRDTKNNYYMLYGKEISYFTVFKANKSIGEMPFEAIFDCLENVGPIYSVSLTKTKDAVEFWIKDKNDLVTCLYLFPYDNGIVSMGV